MRKFLTVVLVCALMGLPSQSFAAITQVDSLLEALEAKNILSKEEIRKIRGEIVEDEKLLRDEGLKQSLPTWVQDMKLKGDLRVRYQNERRDTTQSRHRGRVRFRLGVETKANDKVKLAAGLATGTGDPRSTNETLENSFEKSDLRLDYAYAQYDPTDWASISGGKIMRPFWNPKDLTFDTDITFDGVGASLKKKVMDKAEVFFNTGVFILDENTQENYDSYMYAAQPGVTLTTSANTTLKLAGAYYGFDTVKGYARLANSSSTNSTFTQGGFTRYAYDFDSLGGGAEFTIVNPLGVEQIPVVGFIGEFIKNIADPVDEHDTGYLVGMYIGDKKVAGPGQWQLAYNFRRLERNAFLDIFHDSDFYGGGTHVQGHEYQLSYGLGKNVSLDLDYYRTNLIGGEEIVSRKNRIENLVQADINFKF